MRTTGVLCFDKEMKLIQAWKLPTLNINPGQLLQLPGGAPQGRGGQGAEAGVRRRGADGRAGRHVRRHAGIVARWL